MVHSIFSLKNFVSTNCTKLQEKSCYYLLIMYMKKHGRKSWQIKFWKRVWVICNLYLYYNFALMLQLCICVSWECTCFQPSEVHSFSCTLLHNNICDNKEHYNLIQFTEHWQSFILGSIFLSCLYWVVA